MSNATGSPAAIAISSETPGARMRADHTITAETAREHAEPAAPVVSVHAVDLNGETPVAVRDSLTRYDLAIDFSSPAEDIAEALQAHLRDGVGSGRWARADTRLTPVQVAEAAVRRAVRAEVDGLTTHPRDAAEHLHTAIDDESAGHLARPEVGGFPLDEARALEAFSTAMYATVRALALTKDVRHTAEALRSMLNICIDEARR